MKMEDKRERGDERGDESGDKEVQWRRKNKGQEK